MPNPEVGTYDGLKREWMLLQFHGYDDGNIREIATSAIGDGCINSRAFHGENEQHHVHDPHGGSKPLHDSDGLAALILDSGSDSCVGSLTSDWSDVEDQGAYPTCVVMRWLTDVPKEVVENEQVRNRRIEIASRIGETGQGRGEKPKKLLQRRMNF
ncbi:hypothetical protein QAD02_020543 [Eretmocerus hayati]|uniref:Uncharacterized protein n=1 Tax=Eretmocerus hayati TaxID=131215 RepID=A0ACC2PSI7_9HYME|nr:hypothetical protein QAD02_020543 [Eretmocerus hayati]